MATVADWVDKAEVDWKGATALNRRRREPLPDLVCFHCQQCAEKYLKALLVRRMQTPPLIHDLMELLDKCCKHDPLLAALAPLLKPLNVYAVAARYPGISTTQTNAREAVASTRKVRRILRKALGIP